MQSATKLDNTPPFVGGFKNQGTHYLPYTFSKGFEAVYAVHYDTEKHVHIHLAYNYVSYLDGHKYRSRREDIIEKHTAYLNAYWRAYIRVNERRIQMTGIMIPVVMNLGRYWKYIDNKNFKEEKIVC